MTDTDHKRPNRSEIMADLAAMTRERDRLRTMVDKADLIIRGAAPPGLHSSSWEDIGRALIEQARIAGVEAARRKIEHDELVGLHGGHRARKGAGVKP